ncbi:helix-turn-helix transcriptional regulator [Streptomyces sp. LBUM 1476]|nr:helix-turn-helix domain-containing protein [Streptomyces acidiscabies]MBP5935004.1 helix-turn-helix transcriptional regulator [Streptomyces sp. LBUM 1476]MBZ3917219.1 helix-turn-helix transcriptional regulator [Streptomyces acidiscabies]
MPTPKPGKPVRGSATGRPLMAALDLFGRRWSLRILWELREGPLGFRPLQAQCDDMSSSVMRQRLTELLDAHVVHQLPDSRYELTPLGRDACLALGPLVQWSKRWAATLDAQPAHRDSEGPSGGTPDPGTVSG